jgi:hypothetical integral membrane protein (TIGR02206 family)
MIIFFKNRITAKIDRKIKVIATWLTICAHASDLLWFYLNDGIFWSQLFNLELCNATMMMSFILNLNKKSKRNNTLFYFIYIWSFGAFGAIVAPANIQGFGPDKMRFWAFFVVHGYILLTAVYGIVVDNYVLVWAGCSKSLKVLVMLAAFVGIVDVTCHQNYMFLQETVFPMSLLGEGVAYYINLFLVCLAITVLLWIPHGIRAANLRKDVAKLSM